LAFREFLFVLWLSAFVESSPEIFSNWFSVLLDPFPLIAPEDAAIYALLFNDPMGETSTGRLWLVWRRLFFFFSVNSRNTFFGKNHDAVRKRRLKILGLIFILCCIATLVNPEFYGVYDYIQTVVRDPASQKFVTEWQPPAIDTGQGFVLFYLPFLLLTLVLILTNRKPSLTELMLYLGFGVFGLISLRNCIWFLLVSAPILAGHLANIDLSILRSGYTEHAQAYGATARRRRELPFLNRAISVAMLLVLILQSPWMRVKLHNAPLQSPLTPVGVMNFMDRKELKGNIFHPQLYGDYLIWRLWPKKRSFFDGRVHLFGESFVESYFRILKDSAWEGLLERHNIRYLLLSKDKNERDQRRMIETARRSGRWKLLYEDDLSILFEKI
jgi:hypothetical protein